MVALWRFAVGGANMRVLGKVGKGMSMQVGGSIFVDARCFQSPDFQFRGIGRYTASLLNHLPMELRAGRKIIAVCDRKLPDLPDELIPLFDEVTHRVPDYRSGGILFNPSPMTAAPGWCTNLLKDPGFLTIAVVHDFIPYDFGGFLQSRRDADLYAECLEALSSYRYFFSNSRGTAKRLSELCDVGEDRIHVTGIAARAGFLQENASPCDPQERTDEGPFVLTISGSDPRKNAGCVAAAAKSVDLGGGKSPGVVVVGDFSRSAIRVLQLELAQKGIGVEGLTFLSDVSDVQLANLCRTSLAVVASSFCEGFSMPVVEGIFAGGVVVASDIEAHRELVATPEALFDPKDSRALAAILQRLADDPREKGRLLRLQQPHVAHLRDEKEVARKAWQWLFDLKKEIAPPRQVRIAVGARPRFAFLTPFPPDRSGVAVFSDAALRWIGKKVDIGLFTNAAVQLRQYPHIRSVSSLDDAMQSDLRSFDEIFFVIGNSHFHTRIVDLAQQMGGPCILHDARMLDYFAWRQGDGIAAFATSELGRPVSHAQIETWLQQPLTTPAPFMKTIVDMARPPIVHSKILQAEIKKHYGADALYLPQLAQFDFDNAELSPEKRGEVRKRLGLEDRHLNIGSFGQPTTHKGIIETVFAIKELVDWGVPVKLWLIGGAAPHLLERLDAMIERLQLRDAVVITGHASEAEYCEFLRAVDVGLQLRKMPFGQVSGALTDCIVAGLSCVANESLAKAIASPDFVQTVPDVLSPVLIGEKLLEMWEGGITRTRYLNARAKWIAANSAETYAHDFLKYFAPELIETSGLRGVA